MAGHLVVAQLIAPAPSGGAETVVRSLMTEGQTRRYHHHLLALLQTEDASPLVDQLKDEGLPVTEIRCGRRQYGREARQVSRALTTIGADILHTHVYHADLVGAWAGKRSQLPVVATAHGLTGGDWKNRLYQWLDLRALRRFDGVLAVSRPLRDTLLDSGIQPRQLHLIPNGFAPGPVLDREEARRFLGLDQSRPTVGWIGRFTEEKDPCAFVDLVAQLDIPGLQAIMLGDGPLEDTVRERVQALSVQPSDFSTPGRVDSAAKYLQAFDALVLTSHTEGTPMVLLEAMAAGTPIATYAVGGIPDFLNQDTACIVPPGHRHQLAQGLRTMFDDPIATQQRARQAGELLDEKFSPGAWLDQIEAIYDGILAG